MRIKAVRPAYFVSQLRSERCGAEAQHDVEEGFNNFLQIEFDAGWGSAIGDGLHVEVDLCHSCLKQTLGTWLRISPSAWNQLPGPERLDTTDDVPIKDCGQEDDPSGKLAHSAAAGVHLGEVIAPVATGDRHCPDG